MESKTTKKVLLIDDDGELAKIRCILLTSNGYDALCARSLEEGRANWTPSTFDLVLIDTKSGPEKALNFCDEMKKLDPQQVVAIIANANAVLPESNCPDQIIQSADGARNFIQRVNQLMTA